MSSLGTPPFGPPSTPEPNIVLRFYSRDPSPTPSTLPSIVGRLATYSRFVPVCQPVTASKTFLRNPSQIDNARSWVLSFDTCFPASSKHSHISRRGGIFEFSWNITPPSNLSTLVCLVPFTAKPPYHPASAAARSVCSGVAARSFTTWTALVLWSIGPVSCSEYVSSRRFRARLTIKLTILDR